METGRAASNERRRILTQDELTKAFRVIEAWATEARQMFNNGGDDDLVRAKLTAIQLEAQAGMQATLADARKLAAFDGLLVFVQKIADDEHDDACDVYAYKPGDCTCLVDEAKALITKANETAPDAEAPRAGSNLGVSTD